MAKILKKIEEIVLYATIFLIPLIVLPFFANPYSLPKLIVLSFGVGLIIFIRAVRIIIEGKFEFSFGKFGFQILVLLIAYLLSGILMTPNKMEAFFIPGGATIIITSSLLYFLISSLEKKEKKNLKNILFLSGSFVAIASLLSFTKAFEYIPQLPEFVKNSLFNTLGGQLPASIYMLTVLPIGLAWLFSEKDFAKKVFVALTSLLLVASLSISIYNLLPGKPAAPRLLDLNTSWSVAVDTLKDSPILGIGPGNYLSAFNQYRPLAYNSTDNWSLRFSNARNLYLTVVTETGLLGAIGLIFILLEVYKRTRKILEKEKVKKNTTSDVSLVSLIILLTIFVFFSATESLLVLLFTLLALSSQGEKITLNLVAQSSSNSKNTSLALRLPAIVLGFPVIAALIVFGFYSSRAIKAEAIYKNGIDALVKNDGEATYENLRLAINTNPYVDRYHASFSQINFALANSVSQNQNITDEDRNTIAQLIQQAITEAKTTVTLNSQRAGNWEVLASIYRAIIPFAQGADQFALEAYGRAINLDPINPNLRITLGGIYYALGDYDSTIDALKLAVLAKSDYPNGHYNLAFAYREKGEIEKAISQMSIVLSLVEPDSEDYQIARAELENLEARKTNLEAESSENLTPPEEAVEPAITPPLELPENSDLPISD